MINNIAKVNRAFSSILLLINYFALKSNLAVISLDIKLKPKATNKYIIKTSSK